MTLSGYRGHYNWHARMRRTLLGPASAHPCVEGCGRPAQGWSLNVEHCVVGVKWVYVEDVTAYSPRCKKCHQAHDAPFRVVDEKVRANISAAQKKRFAEQPVSAETRARKSAASRGKVRTPEQRENYRRAAYLREYKHLL